MREEDWIRWPFPESAWQNCRGSLWIKWRRITESRRSSITGRWTTLLEEFGEKRPDLFAAAPLVFKIKKEGPITNSQKVYLRDLLKYHRIESNVKIEMLTKSEASRMIDNIISQHGKMMR